MTKVRRLLAMVWLGCALVLWGTQAQAQLKSPAEIEAEIIARQRATARPATPPLSTPAPIPAAPPVPPPAALPPPAPPSVPPPVMPAPVVPAPVVPAPGVAKPAMPPRVAPPAAQPLAVPAPRAEQDAQIAPPAGADYEEIHQELAELEAHPAPGLGLPVLGMVGGYAGSLVLAVSAIAYADAESSLSERNPGAVLGISAVAMFAVGIASNVWLNSRIKYRRQRLDRLTRLRLEQATLTGSTSSRLHARAQLARLAVIERELTAERRDYGRYGLTGPIVMISAGFSLCAPLVLLGIIASALGGPGAPFIAAGALSGAVGFVGVAMLGRRRKARQPIGERIRELEGEKRSLAPISLDLQLRPDHASFSLQARF